MDRDEICVTPIAKSGYRFNSWGYKNSTTFDSWERVPSEYVSADNRLIFNDSRISEIFPSGTKFEAMFVSETGGGDGEVDKKQHTVTIKVAEWINNGWQQKGDYGVYWFPGSVTGSEYTITKKLTAGETCLFSFLLGSDPFGVYEFIGIKDTNRNNMPEVNNEGNCLSFTVSHDIIYYVEVAYKRY